MSRFLFSPLKRAAVECSSNKMNTACRFSTVYYTDTNPSRKASVYDGLLHKKVSIRRTFESASHTGSMLFPASHKMESNEIFDSDYKRDRNFIRNHQVGNVILNPILINGLIGSLVESQFPSGFMEKSSLKKQLPLIVGCEVEADMEVVRVNRALRNGPSSMSNNDDAFPVTMKGLEVELKTKVTRVSDGKEIAIGTQTIWLPEQRASAYLY